MTVSTGFSGFPAQAFKFLGQLTKNNSQTWFKAHRNEYEAHLLEPGRAFITTMGQTLEAIAPAIHAEPKVNRSLFRIQRDTRFAKDKTPYKTHISFFWWEGAGPRMECPGFYAELSPDHLRLGGGLYNLTRPQLLEFRASLVHPEHGPALAEAVAELAKSGHPILGQHYKRLPRGIDSDHPNAELALHNGLYTGWNTPIPPEAHTEALVDYCFARYVDLLPLHVWLRGLTERAEAI